MADAPQNRIGTSDIPVETPELLTLNLLIEGNRQRVRLLLDNLADKFPDQIATHLDALAAAHPEQADEIEALRGDFELMANQINTVIDRIIFRADVAEGMQAVLPTLEGRMTENNVSVLNIIRPYFAAVHSRAAELINRFNKAVHEGDDYLIRTGVPDSLNKDLIDLFEFMHQAMYPQGIETPIITLIDIDEEQIKSIQARVQSNMPKNTPEYVARYASQGEIIQQLSDEVDQPDKMSVTLFLLLRQQIRLMCESIAKMCITRQKVIDMHLYNDVQSLMRSLDFFRLFLIGIERMLQIEDILNKTKKTEA